jgi:hypothetical protein
MTHFDIHNFYEIERSEWTYETLRPPLTFAEVLSDIKFHWVLYKKMIKSIRKRLFFLVLRIFQRISYNIGWIISRKRLIKKYEWLKNEQ